MDVTKNAPLVCYYSKDYKLFETKNAPYTTQVTLIPPNKMK